MVYDGYQRKIEYLRLSVTDRCNYRCSYCRPADGTRWLDESELLTDEEIVRLVRVLGQQGITRIRLTGGEPLLRTGLVDLIAEIQKLGLIEDLSLTTNGSLLSTWALPLKQAGLNRINISLDTVDQQRFAELTGGGNVDDVLGGIEAAIQAGLLPVKINVVLTDAVQDQDVEFFQKLVHETPVIVRFIEYMPSHGCRVRAGMTVRSVTQQLQSKHRDSLAPPRQNPHGCGPARYLKGEGDEGMFGFIAPISDGYCDRCNRIRLTPDGKLRPCLLSETELDIRMALRNNEPDERIVELFFLAVESKPSAHSLNRDHSRAFHKRGMSQIGG